MLQSTAAGTLADTVTLSPADVAVRLVEAEAKGGIVYVAGDHAEADAVAALVRAFAPDRTVIAYPASDALPGTGGGASAANIGARVSALHALQDRRSSDAILIVPVAATLDRVAPAAAYRIAPPRITRGDAVDSDAFRKLAEEIGYRDDDRVDEPGEYAVRGGVIEVYPVDAGNAVRITIEDGVAASIDCYDAVTQRSSSSLESVAIGRASEPDAAATESILDHLPDALLAIATRRSGSPRTAGRHGDGDRTRPRRAASSTTLPGRTRYRAGRR